MGEIVSINGEATWIPDRSKFLDALQYYEEESMGVITPEVKFQIIGLLEKPLYMRKCNKIKHRKRSKHD